MQAQESQGRGHEDSIICIPAATDARTSSSKASGELVKTPHQPCHVCGHSLPQRCYRTLATFAACSVPGAALRTIACHHRTRSICSAFPRKVKSWELQIGVYGHGFEDVRESEDNHS